MPDLEISEHNYERFLFRPRVVAVCALLRFRYLLAGETWPNISTWRSRIRQEHILPLGDFCPFQSWYALPLQTSSTDIRAASVVRERWSGSG